MRWPTEKLGNIVSHKKGFAFKSEWFQLTGVPVVKVTNFTDNSVDLADLDCVSESVAAETHGYALTSNDVVIQTVGSWPNNPQSVVGKVVRVPKSLDGALLNQNAVILRSESKIRKDYLFYLLKDRSFKGFIINTAQGAANQASITLESLFRFEFFLPPSEIQEKIAAILSAYDDLIENNQRRIVLLEKIAEEVYREWFVRLRFPGHDKMKVTKGVPEGWDVLPFSEIVNINPSERLDRSEEVPFVGMETLSLSSMFFTVKEHRRGVSGSKFRNRDVLFPRITPSVENGKRGIVMTLADNQVGCGSTEFIVMREKVIGPEHIYFLTCSPEFRKHAELSMTGASGRQRVQEDCFSFFLVKTPPNDVRLQFAEVMSPHFAQIQLLSLQNESLMKSRDMLLPRLISGKLSVENLDIQFPPGMEESAHEH